MIRAVIVEDELMAADHLAKELKSFTEPVTVEKIISSVKEGVAYFKESPEIDIVFMDIHLSDGQSFEIFHFAEIKAPVVFVTTYEQFTLEAFRHNGIEYVLKPYDTAAIHRALQRYRQLKVSMSASIIDTVKAIGIERNKKKVIVVKKGTDFCVLKTSEVAYFFSSSYVVFAVDKDNTKYIVEGINLTDLMEELESTIFYRVNRNYILNVNFIKRYKITDRVKLQFELTLPVAEEIIMGQENAKQFRKWIKTL